MATTVIFIEIMIMGLITFTWLFLLSFRIGAIHADDLAVALSIQKEWSGPVLVIFAGLAYQLGSLMNTTSFGVMEFLIGKRIRNLIMAPYDHERALAIIYQKGSAEAVRIIDGHLTYIRLSRSAVLNFFFLGMTLLTFGSRFLGTAVLFLLLSLASYPLWRIVYRLRHIDIRAAYEAIVEPNGKSSPTVT